jgi:hypothetical protein
MTDTVPLIRRFTSISASYQDHDIQLDEVWSMLERGARIDWSALRDFYRVVILADAGAGKTFELRAEAERLAASGRAAFFIRIEDIDANFGAAFEVGTREAFERWLNGTEEAWFFLDSVDEVRLEAPRAFEAAMCAFAELVHDARQRAHVYISSRPYAWRSKLDRTLIDDLLPHEPPQSDDTAEDGETPEARRGVRADSGLQLFRLAPLDRDDIRIFAGHRGIDNPNAFLDAIDRASLFGLAQLPFDLEDMLAIWQETKSLASRLAVLEQGIRRRLAPVGTAPVTLPLDKALEGARRLALAATLTVEMNIRMPGSPGGGLEAAALLAGWAEEEIHELLGRGVFSDAIYGAVRFRHRETRELLAAQWLVQALGVPEGRAKVEHILFREVYGEVVVVPRLRPLLPWLILFDEAIRLRALSLWPEVATEGGDASQLPLDIRRAILRAIVSNIVAGNSSGGDNSEIARIAQVDLSAEALTQINAHESNDEAIFFLGRLVWQGEMRDPAERLEPIALDSKRGIYARIASTRAVVNVLGADAARSLWTTLNKSSEMLPRRLLAEIVEGASPNVASVGLLLHSLDRVEPHVRFASSGLSRSIHGLIDRMPLVNDRAPEQPLERLVEGLASFLAREPHIERRECEVSEAFSWLMGPAVHAVERLIVGRSQACFDSACLLVLSQVPAVRYWSDGDDRSRKTKLGELVPRWVDLNDALFWHTIAAARARRKPENGPLLDDWDVSWIGHFWGFDAASFPRTLKWILERTSIEDRSIALSRSFRTYVQAGRPAGWRRALWRTVGDDAGLKAKLGQLMRPTPSPERRRWRATERKWEQRRRLREESRASFRTELVAKLKANPDLVRAPVGSEDGQLSWDQVRLLQCIEGDGSQIGRSAGLRWQTLVPEFGEAVAEAFCDAAVRQWRAYRPTLRSEGGDSSGIPYAVILAMAGLEIEAGEDGRGLAELNKDDARHAMRYVPEEFNGFPYWFQPLYQAYPALGFELIWGETRWELANSEPNRAMHYILHDLVYFAPWLHVEMAEPIYSWFTEHGAANDDCLRYGCTIMSSGGMSAQKLSALAELRIGDKSTPVNQIAAWFAVWVNSSPDVAIPSLEAKLSAMPRPEDTRFAEMFVVALVGDRRASRATIAGDLRRPAHLKSLYLLMHRHIRVDEDIDRTNGVTYSPTLRDDAQDARSRLFSLLADTPGEESYRQILALAEDHPVPDYRAYMRRKAHDRAVVDSDRVWPLQDAVNFICE